MNTYKGFSFFRYQYDKSIVVTDVQLVKNDLYNHIFTRKGERLKMPLFGTQIPDLLFEPMTEELLFTVDSELRRVFNYDPRVEIVSFDIYPFYDTQTILAVADLNYIELDVTDRFDLNLEFQG